ncbi:MAG TPA: hypothetical protein VF553_07335 [Pyrinomonadaceae bacterium]
MGKILQIWKNWKPTKSFIVALPSTWIFGAMIIGLGYKLSPTDQLALTWVASFTGYMLGLPLGMLISPHKGEEDNFRLLGSYLLTLFTGYFLSKLTSPGVERWVVEAASNPLRGGRIMLFLSSLVLGVVQAFILRSYLDEKREQGKLSKTGEPQKPVPEGQNNSKPEDKINLKSTESGGRTAGEIIRDERGER